MEPGKRLRPSALTRSWLVDQVAPGSRIVAVTGLVGGVSSAVHRVTLEPVTGRRFHVVLRQWPLPRAGEDRPAWAPSPATEVRRRLSGLANEVEVLGALRRSGVPAPEVLAADQDVDGYPTIVMTHLAGRIDLSPSDPEAWIRQMAAVLPPIHDVEPVGLTTDFSLDFLERGVPSWISRPEVWREAARVLEDPVPTRRTFVHGDYQHFNMLWSRARLSGVVDWTWSGVGAPGRDVGHCRLNLAVLFSTELAERFRLAYEAEAGRPVDRWWDVLEILVYGEHWRRFIPVQVGGRVPVDSAGMHERVQALLATAVR